MLHGLRDLTAAHDGCHLREGAPGTAVVVPGGGVAIHVVCDALAKLGAQERIVVVLLQPQLPVIQVDQKENAVAIREGSLKSPLRVSGVALAAGVPGGHQKYGAIPGRLLHLLSQLALLLGGKQLRLVHQEHVVLARVVVSSAQVQGVVYV